MSSYVSHTGLDACSKYPAISIRESSDVSTVLPSHPKSGTAQCSGGHTDVCPSSADPLKDDIRFYIDTIVCGDGVSK